MSDNLTPETKEPAMSGHSRVSADDQVFAGWVDKMKERFREPRPTVASAPATAAKPAAGKKA